jgi:hypothetical protein
MGLFSNLSQLDEVFNKLQSNENIDPNLLKFIKEKCEIYSLVMDTNRTENFVIELIKDISFIQNSMLNVKIITYLGKCSNFIKIGNFEVNISIKNNSVYYYMYDLYRNMQFDNISKLMTHFKNIHPHLFSEVSIKIALK